MIAKYHISHNYKPKYNPGYQNWVESPNTLLNQLKLSQIYITAFFYKSESLIDCIKWAWCCYYVLKSKDHRRYVSTLLERLAYQTLEEEKRYELLVKSLQIFFVYVKNLQWKRPCHDLFVACISVIFVSMQKTLSL